MKSDDAALLGRHQRPLTQTELDAQGCGTPNCGHDHSVLWLHGACHPSLGTRVAYHKTTGVLEITCRRCHRHIATIEVAP
jgi:hypothetical protein